MTFWRMLRERAWLPILMVGMAITTAVSRDANAQRRRVSSANQSGNASQIDTTFSFNRGGTVVLTANSGDIVVNGWSRDEIRVHAVSDNDDIRMSASSTRVTVDVAGGHGGDTRFDVTVPYGVRVTTSSQSGDITVHGTRGQLDVRSNSGSVDIEDITTRLDVNSLSGDITGRSIMGDVAISALSGEVHLSDVRGNVDVGGVSGDISLRGVAAKVVRAKTTSGSVLYDGTIDPAGSYELTSHSGDVKLRVPRDASAQLTVSTWNGTIDSDFPITLKPGDHALSVTRSKRYVFEIGGGGARINAETFSGDITISSSGRGPSGARP
ncbi:MAG: DUF4097 family beta strand repeat-containing protein [Gemmatimonadaceae bacterium]